MKIVVKQIFRKQFEKQNLNFLTNIRRLVLEIKRLDKLKRQYSILRKSVFFSISEELPLVNADAPLRLFLKF